MDSNHNHSMKLLLKRPHNKPKKKLKETVMQESFTQAKKALWKIGRLWMIDYFKKEKGQKIFQSTLQTMLNGSIYAPIQVLVTQKLLLNIKLNAKIEAKAQI